MQIFDEQAAASILQDAGYDMLNADNGTYDSWYWAHPPVYMPLNCNMAEVTRLKEVVEIPVVCAGRMQPDEASASISEGKTGCYGNRTSVPGGSGIYCKTGTGEI